MAPSAPHGVRGGLASSYRPFAASRARFGQVSAACFVRCLMWQPGCFHTVPLTGPLRMNGPGSGMCQRMPNYLPSSFVRTSGQYALAW